MHILINLTKQLTLTSCTQYICSRTHYIGQEDSQLCIHALIFDKKIESQTIHCQKMLLPFNFFFFRCFLLIQTCFHQKQYLCYFVTCTPDTNRGNSPWDQILFTTAKIGVTQDWWSLLPVYIQGRDSVIGLTILVPATPSLARALY